METFQHFRYHLLTKCIFKEMQIDIPGKNENEWTYRVHGHNKYVGNGASDILNLFDIAIMIHYETDNYYMGVDAEKIYQGHEIFPYTANANDDIELIRFWIHFRILRSAHMIWNTFLNTNTMVYTTVPLTHIYIERELD